MATDARLLQATWGARDDHSPFAAALLQGLSGAADYTDDGLILASELEIYTRSYVENLTKTRQTPQLYKLDRHDGGEFVFQVTGRALCLNDAPALRAENCPYRGAQAFIAEDRALFCGRRVATERLLERVQTQPFTAVIGPSRSGKSSLLQAGLTPHLRDDPKTTVVIVRPGADPIAGTCDEIPVAHSPSLRPTSPLGRIDAWMESNPDGRLVIIVDQAEELVVVSPEDARTTFLHEIGRALDRHAARLRVVFAVRSDHEPALSRSALCGHWSRGRFEVPAPTQDELREMIKRPARHRELRLDPPSLIDTLINAVHTMPGALGALSETLHELYIRVVARDEDRLLSSADYEAMDGVRGVLTRRALAALRGLTDVNPAFELTGRRILLRMTAQRNGAWVRRCVDPADLVSGDAEEDDRGETLLRALERAGVVVRDQAGWELAHDALVGAWPALFRSCGKAAHLSGDMLAVVASALTDIAQATRAWALQGKQAANLWHGDQRLRRVRRLMRASESYFSALEREFVRRSLARQHAGSMQKLALVVAVFAASAGAVAGWDRYLRQFDDYYVGYVRRWGVPTGIHAISATDAAHRPEAVRLSRTGRSGRVGSAELVHYGEPCAREPALAAYQPDREVMTIDAREAPRACRWELFYESETATVSREVAKGADGRSLSVLAYRPVADLHIVLAQYIDEHGRTSRRGHGDVELVEIRRNEQGLDIEKVYLQSDGRTAAVSDRAIHVEQLAYDSGYDVIETLYLDRGRRPTRDEHGVAGWRARYDIAGNKIEQTYVDPAGGRTHDRNGIARITLSYDPHRNQVARRWFDASGAPVRDDHGTAGWQLAHDAGTKETERTNLDEAGVATPDIHGVARRHTAYDVRGNPIRIRNRDQAGHPVRDDEGAAGWNLAYDAQGNLIVLIVVDEHDQPTRNREGYAGWRRSYDDHGQLTKEVYVDEHGMPTRTRRGVAGVAMSYDQGGARTVEYLDEAGRRTHDQAGIARLVMSYDERGKMIEVRYFGEDDKPARTAEGVAGRSRSYDPRGNLTEEAYLDEDGHPMPSRARAATVRMAYDAEGNELSMAAFDEADRPTQDASGIAITKLLYDGSGNRIRTSYFDTAAHPIRATDGVAGFTTTYDEQGHEIEVSYFDENGQVTRNKDGYARVRISYDIHGRKNREVYLDDNDRPTHNRDGVSGWHRVFDDRGNQVELAYFDEAGRPLRNKHGVAAERASYDPLGNQIELRHFDEAGRLIPAAPATQETKQPTYVDAAEHRTPGVLRGATFRVSYDAYGRELRRQYLDQAGKPTRNSDGVASVAMDYDAHGRNTRISYFDEAGSPVLAKDGMATLRMSYDDHGNKTETSYFDKAGKRVLAKDGAAGWRAAYDEYGHVIQMTNFDLWGERTRATNGVVRWKAEYDRYGNQIELVYLDWQDHVTRGADGAAIVRRTYQPDGRLARTIWLDPHERILRTSPASP